MLTGPATKLPRRVRLVEVGPRDGLQNEPATVATAVKIALIDQLSAAGFPAVEATAFVSPKWVPQMADAAAVMAGIRRKDGVRYPVLTPNLKGFEAALAAKADEVAVFVAASKTFSTRHLNCTIAESLERARPVFAAASANAVRVRGYISCVLGCPYEGEVAPTKVAEVGDYAPSDGRLRVSLGDTIGVGTAGKTQAPHRRGGRARPDSALAGHFHDTYGPALANVYAAMEMGIRDVRLLGRRARRLPLREGRHGQSCERGRSVPARWARHRDRRRHDEASRRGPLHFGGAGPRAGVRVARALERQSPRQGAAA